MKQIFCDLKQLSVTYQNKLESKFDQKTTSVFNKIIRAYNFGLNPIIPVANIDVIMSFLKILITHDYINHGNPNNQRLHLHTRDPAIKSIDKELLNEIIENRFIYDKILQLIRDAGYLDEYGKRISHARGDVRRILLGIIWLMIRCRCFTYNYCPCRSKIPRKLNSKIIITRVAAVWAIYRPLYVKEKPETLIEYAKAHLPGLSEIEQLLSCN